MPAFRQEKPRRSPFAAPRQAPVPGKLDEIAARPSGPALSLGQQLDRPRIRPGVIALTLALLEIGAIWGAVALAQIIVPLPGLQVTGVFLFGLGAALWVSALTRALGGYGFRALRTLPRSLGMLVAGQMLGFGALAGVMTALTGQPAALTCMALAVGIAVPLAGGLRLATALRIGWLAKTGSLEHRIAAVGGAGEVVPVIREIERDHHRGHRFCGFFDDRRDARSPGVVDGRHKGGTLDDLIAMARKAEIDTVVVALPRISHRRLMELVARLSVLPVDIRVMLDADIPELARKRRSRMGELELIDLYRRPIQGWDAVLKRGFDLVVASMAIVLLIPLMLACALAVRLDSSGPILFRQKRHGFNNRPVWVWKFRSMHADRCDASAINAVRRDDNRVTAVGRVLRRSSLDELPQLFNVLGGTLSLVGPRPHATAARTGDMVYDQVIAAYSARHKIKPGITGWAQVNGWRGELNTAEKLRRRIEHDLYYIEHWSLWLDVKILLRTPWSLITTRNAY